MEQLSRLTLWSILPPLQGDPWLLVAWLSFGSFNILRAQQLQSVKSLTSPLIKNGAHKVRMPVTVHQPLHAIHCAEHKQNAGSTE